MITFSVSGQKRVKSTFTFYFNYLILKKYWNRIYNLPILIIKNHNLKLILIYWNFVTMLQFSTGNCIHLKSDCIRSPDERNSGAENGKTDMRGKHACWVSMGMSEVSIVKMQCLYTWPTMRFQIFPKSYSYGNLDFST